MGSAASYCIRNFGGKTRYIMNPITGVLPVGVWTRVLSNNPDRTYWRIGASFDVVTRYFIGKPLPVSLGMVIDKNIEKECRLTTEGQLVTAEVWMAHYDVDDIPCIVYEVETYDRAVEDPKELW